jgi:O-antigen/teichoic acid export membrane protein
VPERPVAAGRALVGRAVRLGNALAASRTVSAGGWVLAAALVSNGLAAARTLVAAWLLGPGQLGAAAAALLAVGTLEGVTNTGVDAALVSHPGRAEDDLDAAFTLQALRGTLVAGLAFVAAPLVGRFFGLPQVAGMVRALAIVPLTRGLANPAASLLVRRLDFRPLFWWGLPEGVTGLAILVGVAIARRDAWALVAAAIGAQLVGTAASYGVLPRAPRLVFGGRGQRRLVRYGRWVGGTRLLMFVSVYADKVLVGRLLGATELGIYQLAYRVAELPSASVARAAAQVALPALGELRRHPERLRDRYRRLLRAVVAVHVAFAVGAVLLAPAAARLLGAAWRPAAPVVQILAVAMAFRAVHLVSGELLNAVGRPRATLHVHLVRTGVLLLTAYPLLRALGAPGVAAAVLLSNAAAAVVCLRRVRAVAGIGVREPPLSRAESPALR